MQPSLALSENVFQIQDSGPDVSVFLLDLLDVDLAQLIEATLSDGLGLRFREGERSNACNRFLTAEDRLEVVTATAGLAGGHHIVDPLLRQHQALEDVGPGPGLFELVRSTTLDHLLAVRHVNMEHVGEGHEHGTTVNDGHHVRAVGFLKATGGVELVEHRVWVSVGLDFDDHADAFLRRLVADVTNANDGVLGHQIGDVFEHGCFLHLIRDFMDHDRG